MTTEAVKCMTAAERVSWALRNLPGQHFVTTSFGAQSAVMLHLMSEQRPRIPVVMIDTGYLFPETYRFADKLTERLNLNLKVYRAPVSPAWQEARYGHRWARGAEGLAAYNQEVKVKPLLAAIKALNGNTWFTGIRRVQSESRKHSPILSRVDDCWKVNAIADWTDRDVHEYLQANELPYHPLWQHGYVSIGDYHSTRAIHEVTDAEQVRFLGIKRECGIHDQQVVAGVELPCAGS